MNNSKFCLICQSRNKDRDKVEKLNPKKVSNYICRGIDKYDIKDFKGAIEDYSKALAL